MDFLRKFNIKKIVLYLLVIILAAYGLGALILFATGGSFTKGFGPYHTVEDTTTSNLEGIKEIDVDVSSANIDVIKEETNVFKAHLNGKIATSDNLQKPEMQSSQSGSTLFIKVIDKPSISFGSFNSSLKLDVYIPTSYNGNVKLISSSGDINMNDFKFNKLKCNLSSGVLTMNNMSAETFDYDSSSGSLKAEGLTTKTSSLNTSSGIIDITKFSGNLKSSSSSGAIKVQYAAFDNNIDIHSSSGKIEVKLPKTAQFYLDAATSSGGITCSFPITVNGNRRDHSLRGVVVSSKNTVRLDASSGDINVLQ